MQQVGCCCGNLDGDWVACWDAAFAWRLSCPSIKIPARGKALLARHCCCWTVGADTGLVR